MKKKSDQSFEMFGVEMLLSTPSAMNRIWATASDKNLKDAIERALNTVSLTPKTKNDARTLMVRLASMRTFFRGVAIALRDSQYTGDEPHPDSAAARGIMQKLQAMDATRRAARKGGK